MLKLLDCTLRDGGYYTNWDFDKELTQKYFQYVAQLPIDYIEIGYRSTPQDNYFGEYFYLPTSTIKNIKKLTRKKLVIMLNAKDCIDVDLSKLLFDIKEDISLVRIATDPDKIEFSLGLAQKLVVLGFDIALNIMYISKIKDNSSFFTYLHSIHKRVKYMYLVDSFGSIYPKELENLIIKIRSITNIKLGFHGHNNLEQAFSNTMKAIENGVELIDSTVLGMGRGAGNLKTELMLTYLKANVNSNIDLNILGKLTEMFQPLLLKYKWGTNLAYMVSGSYSLPQKDVMEALEIDRYSLSGIVNHLNNENKIFLPHFIPPKNINSCIIIGGGDSIIKHFQAIELFLMLNSDLLIIHSTSKYIKLFEDLPNSQIFAVSGDELLKIDSNNVKISQYVLEPSPRKVNIKIKSIENFYELEKIDFIDKYLDSPLSISLQIALNIEVKNINIVGYDGYSEFKNKKELYLMQENQEIIDKFILKNNLIFLTQTKYKNIDKKSIYAKII